MRIVLTGGPCCGKTSLINEFEKRGHFVLKEQARDVLKEFPDIAFDDLEKEILRRQLKEELKLTSQERFFLDRGIIDTICYCGFHGVNLPSELNGIDLSNRYDVVFILDRIPLIKDNLRVEKNDDEAKKIHNEIFDAYVSLGYNPIRVPLIGIPERVDFILENLKKMIETEVKIKINKEDLNRITNILGEPKFVRQKNIVYKLPKGYLRVRFEQEKVILTCKGERKEDRFGSRKELEVFVDQNILEIIKMIGLEKVSVYFKERADYDLHNCVVSLDLIHNDIYIEIEGEEEDILLVLKELELDKKEIERRQYWELYDKENNS